MRLEFRNERNVAFSDAEPGVYANVSSDTVVIIQMPDRPELLKLWGDFQRQVMRHLRELWSMSNGDITDRWGNLGFADGFDRDELFGFRKVNKNPPRFAFLKEEAIVDALFAINAVDRRTTDGRRPQTLRKSGGSLAGIIDGLSRKEQIALLNELTGTCDLDALLKTLQYARMGCSEVDDLLGISDDPAEAMAALAVATEASLLSKAKQVGRSAGRERIVYAAVWFSHYLVARGIWIWPIGVARQLRGRYPSSLFPICLLLSVPECHRALAEHILTRAVGARGTSEEAVATAFVQTSFASNMWTVPDFAPGCLAAMKEWIQNQPGPFRLSAAMNKIYAAAARHFDVDYALVPHHRTFTAGVRIARSGVDIFGWCWAPSPRNTKKASACLGRPVTEVPDRIRVWALYLREALPMLRFESLSVPTGICNAWLIYLFSLPEREAPRDFSEVDRFKHVNDGNRQPAASTFVGFLNANADTFGNSTRERAVSQLSKLWNLVAARDGFGAALSCPFNHALDATKNVPKRGRTARPAIDMQVRAIIAEENRRDEYALARGGTAGRHHYTVQAEGELKAETIFWPAIPLIVDILLNSPARQSSIRWVDSGEGDEFVVDLEGPREVRNPSPLAVRGRKEGFLRTFHLERGSQQAALGMFFNTDKIKDSHEIPYIASHLPAAVLAMRDLQVRYNPMRSPVIPKDPETGMARLELKRKQPTYPLFRLPDARRIYPPAGSTVMGYWRALLKHCQPLVDDALGYHYPLLDEKGLAIFDMHAMRVSVATAMFEAGENPEAVRETLGHAARTMTAYYRAVSDEHVHGAMMRLLEGRKAIVERAAANDPEALAKLAAEAVHVRDDDRIDAGRVMQFAGEQVGFLDFFAHGICVGGTCEIGGKRLTAQKFAPVWRHRACSDCRFRLTGPRFLSGLVVRYNALSMERQVSSNRDRELNRRIRELEDQQKPVAHMRSAARKNIEFRAAILNEMQKESELIAKCVAMLDDTQDGVDVQTLIVPGPNASVSDIGVRLEEMHELELAHRLLTDTKIVPAAVVDVPPGTGEMLTGGLRKIVDSNGMRDFLATADVGTESKLLEMLGDLLFGHGTKPEQIEVLVNGGATDAQIEELFERMQPRKAIPANASRRGRKS